jgi:hypothetical protein
MLAPERNRRGTAAAAAAAAAAATKEAFLPAKNLFRDISAVRRRYKKIALAVNIVRCRLQTF